MRTADLRTRLLAAALSAVAGFVDAVGFLLTGGFFVSFMSGNTTRMAVGLAQAARPALVAATLIALFVSGVFVGTVIGRLVGRRRRPVLLAFATAGLAAAALCHGLGATSVAVGLLALSMGAENTVLTEEGEAPVGVTYMTGALVKLGKRLALIFFGGDRWAWVPMLLLWLGLLTGAVLGALAFAHLGGAALWIASAAMGLLTLSAVVSPRR
ncbi:MAG: hypothetical protein JWR84_1832 [Caulobacter sp.]|nr:hypothetical protein [Caulobacter sp.]